jgi:DNA replication protein DnaC
MALVKPQPGEVLLALHRLLENTRVGPRVNSEPKHLNTAKDLVAYMQDYGSRIIWVTCPSCSREWNALDPSGLCIGCVDDEHAREKRQTELGIYLRKVLGPYGLARYNFDNFNVDETNEPAFQAAQKFDHHFHNLMFWGPCGTGKTHLAGAILKASAAENLSIQWLNPMYVSRFLRGRWPEDEERFIDSIIHAQVVVFDDIGKARDIETTIRLIYEVLDKRRSMNMNGVIITSNLSLEQIAKAFRDDRITSRIIGACRNNIFMMKGNDNRLPHDESHPSIQPVKESQLSIPIDDPIRHDLDG